MRRRVFITLLGGAAAWPRAARAQQRALIEFLSSRSAADSDYVVMAFQRGLNSSFRCRHIARKILRTDILFCTIEQMLDALREAGGS